MNSQPPENNAETRQERRQKRLRKKRERMPRHGQGLAQTYRNAIFKRLKRRGTDK